MAQQIIDVGGVPTLFSPVPAHALERGDLFCYRIAGGFNEGRLSPMHRACGPAEIHGRQAHVPVLTDYVGAQYHIPFRLNEPVLRAVGVRAGRGGSR